MIQVYADAEALSRAAAELFVEQAKQAVAARGRFAVSLSGGSTPKRVYELLAGPPFRDQVPWQQVHLFWGDERCVSAADSRSNYHMTRLALIDHVPIPKEQMHPIAGSETPGGAAKQYEAVLKSFFGKATPRFDLVFLGLGENGHTASLFPHTPVLKEKTRWASQVNIMDILQLTSTPCEPHALIKELERDFEITLSLKPPTDLNALANVFVAVERELMKKQQVLDRVTMTAPLLNQAALIAFLVAGAGKAEVLHQVIEGPTDPQRLPAQLIKPTSGELRWMLDKAAAARLTNMASGGR